MTASIPGTMPAMEPSWALVDTGAENVLAAAWIADFAGIDLSMITDRVLIGIGGQVAEVTFAEVEMRLHSPDEADDFISWRADVGFVPGWLAPFALVLGQVGFLDRFTMTFHRGAATLAIEERDALTNGSEPARPTEACAFSLAPRPGHPRRRRILGVVDQLSAAELHATNVKSYWPYPFGWTCAVPPARSRCAPHR